MNSPTPERSVAATRAIRATKRLGFGGDAGAGVVFFGGLRQRTAPSGDIRLTTTFAAESAVINLDAGLIVEIVAGALLVFGRDSILSGKRMEDGKDQRPLGAQARAESRITQHRGAKSGLLADGLRRSRITGNTTRARCTILPPTTRNVFIALEAKRGISYLGLGEATDAVIALAVQTAIDAAMSARARDPEPGEIEAARVGR